MRKALLILASLLVGLFLGMVTQSAHPFWLQASDIIGTLWLNGLRMTVIPLIMSLLVIGIAQTAQAASSGAIAGRGVAMMLTLLALSSIMAALVVPALTTLFPIPAGAVNALRSLMQQPHEAGTQALATAAASTPADFFLGIVPSNPFASAAEGEILPLIIFMSAFAFAANHLPASQRTLVTGLFEAFANALITVVGWVLWLAPVGVLALAYTLGRATGAAAFGALAHYVSILVVTGGVVWLGAFLLAIFGAGIGPARFFRATIPAQAVAISTQSSLASLPAMLQGLDQLGVRRPVSEVILPVAVALFRATGPAMNLGVALYVAHWLGVTLSPWQIALGVMVATMTTIGSVSLPGSVSFIGSIAPICLVMGLPIEPLGLLVAVETFPDIMRTLANVTMDMAVTATLDKHIAPDSDMQGAETEKGRES